MLKNILLSSVLAFLAITKVQANEIIIDGIRIKINEGISFGEVGAPENNPRLIAHNTAKQINGDCFERNIDLCVTPKYYIANSEDILVELSNGELIKAHILVNSDGDVVLHEKY